MEKRDKSLESGKVLRYLIHQFIESNTKENFIPVLNCLRDSYVCIPGTMKISNADQSKFVNSKVGDVVQIDEDMHFIPDILSNDKNEKSLPVFSSEDQMGEYGKELSTVKISFLESMKLAKSYTETDGIIVDAFTTSFFVDKGLFDFVASLPSRIED
jgi:hypothetical protein